MCFILTAIKLKENQEAKNAILGVLRNEQVDNPHGTASLCFDNSHKPVIKRDMYLDFATMQKDLAEFEVINYHFRMATVGDKTLKNVHFWKMGNWAFCHNGSIHELGDKDESDSYKFFKHIFDSGFVKKNNTIECKKIKDYTNSTAFWGRFLIINLTTKNIYFFGDFHLYVVNRSYLAFTSSTANFENKLDIMGLEFDLPETIETLDSTVDGVWKFDYASKNFTQIFAEFKEFKQYNPTKSRKREVVKVEKAFNFEEKENINNNEVLASALEKKPRTEESYLKEFYNRLTTLISNNALVGQDIDAETESGSINEYGRTPTEQEFWDFWITPQLQANGQAHLSIGIGYESRERDMDMGYYR